MCIQSHSNLFVVFFPVLITTEVDMNAVRKIVTGNLKKSVNNETEIWGKIIKLLNKL